MKVIFICGINMIKSTLDLWKQIIEDKGYEFIYLENPFYMYNQEEEMKKMVDKYIELFKKGEEYIVIAHSFGGILFNCIYQKLQNINIRKVLLINSPLKMNLWGMNKKREYLGYNPTIKYDAQVYSFGAYFDALVPYKYTKYADEKHYDFNIEHHFGVFFSKKNINKYLELVSL